MTAKELIRAADVVRDYLKYYELGDHEEIAQPARILAMHVLATVRNDDDEPATIEWLYEVFQHVTGFDFNFGTVGGYFEYRDGNHNHYRRCDLPKNPTRGQMRSLFKALRIDAKETGQ